MKDLETFLRNLAVLESRLNNVIYANKRISENVTILTELVVQLNNTNKIMSMRIDLMEKGNKNVESNKSFQTIN